MAQGDTTITIIGNLTGDPELKYTPSGKPVTDMRIASTPRVYDKATNKWVDGDGLFLTCNIWGEMALNAAETLTKGMRVIVQGTLSQRSYENRNGEKRTVYEVRVDEVGPSLKFATAQVRRNQGGQGNQGGGFANQGGGASGTFSNQGGASGTFSNQGNQGGGGWQNTESGFAGAEEPPF